MLNECKLALRISTDAYDGELCSLMDAAARDLAIAGVALPGRVSFSMTQSGISDESTLNDALCKRAIFTYVKMHFFDSAADNERVKESYNVQKTQLMHAGAYTVYGGDDE